MWRFDVWASTHDLLKEGKTEPFHSIIVLSDEELPTFEEAELFAAQMGCRGGRMATRVWEKF